jgi:hypothetical protein
MPIPLNPTMFMRPECAPPSAWIGHIPFAGWLIEALAPATLVELGTHHGASYLAMCQAVEANSLVTQCFAVDTWEGDEHAGVYGEDVYATLAGYHARKYAGFSRLMRMTFDQAATYFKDGSVDLLHIDGLHTYEAVRHDFETWLPKLSARGVVLFHDTFVRERGFGVWRFWDEVSRRYPSFEFRHSSGLGVIAVGTDIPDNLRALLDGASADDRRMISQLFENLGSTAVAHAEIERLTRALAHEQAVGRALAAQAGTDARDAILGIIELVRRDVAHVGNAVDTFRSSMEENVGRAWRLEVEALKAGVDTRWREARQEIAAVREAMEAARAAVDEEVARREELSLRTTALQAQLARTEDVLRRDLVTVRDQVVQPLADGMDALVAAVGNLQGVVEDAEKRRLAARFRRWFARVPSGADAP